ncbi:MAG TPA: hypothetical protein V6C81_29350 [Planktothrix sp.]
MSVHEQQRFAECAIQLESAGPWSEQLISTQPAISDDGAKPYACTLQAHLMWSPEWRKQYNY